MTRLRLLTVLLVASSIGGGPAAAADEPATPSRPEACANPLPQVLEVGLPFSDGLDLETVETSLRAVVGRTYDAGALCPERPLRVNVALGSDYQVLDWLDRALVDMAVAPATAVHLLRRDGVDLIEVADPAAAELEPLLGRVPRLTLSWEQDGAPGSRSGHVGDLVRFTEDLWQRTVEGGLPERPGYRSIDRLVLPSHLSTAGFLMPVLEIEAALDRLAEADADSVADRHHFWAAFFERVCFRLADDLGRRAGAACGIPVAGELLEIATETDPAGRPESGFGPPVLGPRLAYTDRLVIRRAIAEEVFRPDAFPELAADDELRQLQALLERTVPDRMGRELPVPTAFDGFQTADAYFGTRTFAFTVGESLDLIDLHQRISGRSKLALVLPGGGVKAAYQSRVLDELYGTGRLLNSRVSGKGPGEPSALSVESVVGTSGGALLGFFVARLGESGPWNLADVLWRPNGSTAEPGRYLTASEVFGWTDLPRYVSLLLIFLVFCGVLGLFSLRRKGFLAPERHPGKAPERRPSARLRLFLLLAAVLGLTPLLVRWVTGQVAQEHVPEFEGLLYAVLVVVAMFADQCLVWTEEKAAPPALRGMGAPPWLLVAAGLALVVLPVLLRSVPAAGRWLEGEVGAGAAYLTLGMLAAGLALAAVRRSSGDGRRTGEVALWVGSFAVGTVLALALLRLSGSALLAALDRTPLLLVALFSAFLVTAVVRYTAGGGPDLGTGRISRGYTAVESWFLRQAVSGRLRTLAAVLVPLLVCLIVLDLTRPEAGLFRELSLERLVFAPSKLHAPRGALAVCLGAVLSATGTLLMLHSRPNHYRLESVDRFRDAVALVIVGLAVTVYATLAITVALIGWIGDRPGLEDSALVATVAQLTLFELTPAFWIGLLVVSGLASFAVVGWAKAGRLRGGRIGRFLDGALCYLCSVHPNGHLVPRRFLRLIALATFGLVWWNFLLAPALYGNRYAMGYLLGADRRFEVAFCRSEGFGEEACAAPGRAPTSNALTARYLVPANALTTDGTRFVLAVPGDEECPAVPAAPGVTWRRFHAIHAVEAHAEGEGDDACEDLDLSDPVERATLIDYVFASGSPFPAFPPRRVIVDEELQLREALVDGGYSNNVPLEAAAKIGAEQALVIHSSHPAPAPQSSGWLTALGGPLVDNLPRLLGFLYQRSQQLDRRSGTALFVISLAPSYSADWPLLTDFRSSTVARMIEQAEQGLEQRIGLVESWGPPRIQVSFEMPAAEISSERRRLRDGSPATR
jgi:predicted acylesterase/phospholipase RssA